MIKNLVLSFSLLFIFNVLAAQVINIKVDYVPAEKNESIISYTPGIKLTWPDFQGIPKDTANAAAITASGMGYNFNLHRTEDSAWFTFTVTCTFSKPRSWVLPDRTTTYILNHEQRHFDITYVNTILFIKMLKQADLTVKNYRKVIQEKYRDISATLTNMQTQYDNETKNGSDPAKQSEWNKKVDVLLSEASL